MEMEFKEQIDDFYRFARKYNYTPSETAIMAIENNPKNREIKRAALFVRVKEMITHDRNEGNI